MNQKLVEIVKKHEESINSVVDKFYTEYNNSEKPKDKKIILGGMDIDYVSRDVAEKHYYWLMKTSEKDIIKEILKSNVFNGIFSDEKSSLTKTTFLVEMLNAKRILSN